MSAIDKVISIAEAEVGYLEKATPSNLDSKTGNAGSNNYTRYWRDIQPSYQGQPWCACFVTWCFAQAFGKDKAAMMLKHYPYVYCPTMAQLFELHANPERGDIVIFKRGGTFTHTGIVTGVSGDYFTTIEGNTSGSSGIVANGGGVFSKGYYNSHLPGTKFCRPDWNIAESKEEEDNMTAEQKKALETAQSDIADLRQALAELKSIVAERTGYYNYIDNNMNQYYKPTIQKLVGNGYLEGNEKGELMLTTDMMRLLTILDRAGIFG